jgi:hypothetical protein
LVSTIVSVVCMSSSRKQIYKIFMSVCAQVSGARTRNKQMEEEDLIDAEEIRALVRGLAVER